MREIDVCCHDFVEVRQQRLAIKVTLVMSAGSPGAERCLRFVGEQRYLHAHPAA